MGNPATSETTREAFFYLKIVKSEIWDRGRLLMVGFYP
jgi:hypothetical protein